MGLYCAWRDEIWGGGGSKEERRESLDWHNRGMLWGSSEQDTHLKKATAEEIRRKFILNEKFGCKAVATSVISHFQRMGKCGNSSDFSPISCIYVCILHTCVCDFVCVCGLPKFSRLTGNLLLPSSVLLLSPFLCSLPGTDWLGGTRWTRLCLLIWQQITSDGSL